MKAVLFNIRHFVAWNVRVRGGEVRARLVVEKNDKIFIVAAHFLLQPH